MPPTLALIFWLIFVLVLLRYDPAKDARTSVALWVPLIWMFIAGSRLPAQWLGGPIELPDRILMEGNPIDRTVFFFLIVLSVVILISRSFKWDVFFSRNLALMAFLAFALLSVTWSDFPDVAFKRWFRDLGNYLVVLVVLSDPRPLEAVRTLLRRLAFLLIPLSILVIKYYPEIGRNYDTWTGMVSYTGATTTKDVLGTTCLISGIFFFWDMVTRWPDRKQTRTKRIMAINVAFIAMTLWLLNLADCATCKVCLVLACLLIAAAHTKIVKRNPAPLKIFIPVFACLALFLVFGIDMKAMIAASVGRDPTFTDRTLLWDFLLKFKINEFLGTGYESFWLGPRLEQIWARWQFRPNQAHNGYIEIYLNLGLIGATLLVGFLIASYWTLCRNIKSFHGLGSLQLAFWAVLPIYNMTTSDFGKGELMWIVFLLAAIAAPVRGPGRIQTRVSFDNPVTEQFPSLSPQMIGQGR